MRIALCLVVAAATVGLPSCSVNPVTGRPEVVLVSQGKERELGAEEHKKVVSSMGLVDDPRLTSYVAAIGERLAAQFPEAGGPFEFHVVDTVEPNAFALPGGFVYVSRGLLALANSEDELANVIGHEVGHVLARHSSRRLTVAAPFAIVTGIGSLATGIVSPTLGRVVGGLGGLTGDLVIAPYSREQEKEADRMGMDLAAKAGWDPMAMSSFMHTLEREEALREGKPRRFSFLASHPTTPQRVANTERGARKLTRAAANPIAADRGDFLRRLDGLVVGENPAAGVFVGGRFLHPDLGFAVEPPTGWKNENLHEAVISAEPQQEAVALLRAAAAADDPMAQVCNVAAKAGFDPDTVDRETIHGHPAAHVAFRAESEDGPVAVDMTWIARQGTVYEMLGITRPERSQRFREIFRRWAHSFRPLAPSEMAEIRAQRMRVKEARAGETLSDLAKRTDCVWEPEFLAVANGIDATARLQQGQILKVAVSERYR